LQNVRRRHADSVSLTLSTVKHLDSDFESRIRCLTGDKEPNEPWVMEKPKTGVIEKGIDKYAYVVGSGVGVAISAAVVAIWLGLGKVLQWDSNWWLIIGTYTGLVGFVDGFVLRNVYQRQSLLLHEHLQKLDEMDAELYCLTGLSLPENREPEKERAKREKSLAYRISKRMIVVCSLPWAVVGSLVVVGILLAIATGMKWSETGQLIANSPTMIVEGFFLLVLVQAHNMADGRRREQFGDVAARREMLGVVLGGDEGERKAGLGSEITLEGSGDSVSSLAVEKKV
jgi:low-affinity ferrous iron transport protein